ncbi:MAG: hypothetical protein K2X48_12005 [Chitinophagaceae bacterium]|nr:hypothetical protein [Chitinophagaceae bacterium]
MSFKIEPSVFKKEFLRVNLKKAKIDSHIHVFRFKDKDTKQIVYYAPSVELSGYGATDKKAQQMFFISVEDFYSSLALLSPKKLQSELQKFGWRKNKVQTKEYSPAYVDLHGQIQNLNMVAEEIEMLTIDV